MGYIFGRTSKRRSQKVTEYLTNAADEALAASSIDMTIPWRGGFRTAAKQHEIYLNGNSRADGYSKKSYHQTGQALDVIPYVNGEGRYFGVDEEFIKFAKLMFLAFEHQQTFGDIPEDLHLHWGGYWGAKDKDGDGVLEAVVDKTGWDKAHWELRDYPQRNVLKL
jgi:peptidoglycan L-alanyl-D-glutamate endopeptidase CwlK